MLCWCFNSCDLFFLETSVALTFTSDTSLLLNDKLCHLFQIFDSQTAELITYHQQEIHQYHPKAGYVITISAHSGQFHLMNSNKVQF